MSRKVLPLFQLPLYHHSRLHRTISTSTSTRALQDQIFTLPSGRILGFASYGSPTDHPVLYFHGFPSSRLEASVASAIAHRHSIRLLALDRPGFGLSSPQPGRSILDWPNDIKSFTEGMQIDKFAVLGLSGGGPYALACAYALPGGMLTGMGLFASAPPWEAGVGEVERYRRVMDWMARKVPGVLRVFLEVVVAVVRWIARSGPMTRRVDGWLEREAQKEEKDSMKVKEGVETTISNRPASERREDLYRMLLDEPFLQGVGPTVQELLLLSSPDWGFRFQDVKCSVPIRIWHGAKDANAPVSMIRYMAERLPNCVYREYENDTHYTMYKHIDEAISELVPDKEDDGV